MIKRILDFFSNSGTSNTERKNPRVKRIENYKEQVYMIRKIKDEELRKRKFRELDEEAKLRIYDFCIEVNYFKRKKLIEESCLEKIPLDIREAELKQKKEN